MVFRADWFFALDPCSEAVDWARTQPDADTAWRECERGDWMLWLLGRLAGPPMSDSRRPLVLAACECARLALSHVTEGEERPRIAIETAERWARGEDVTVDDLRAAANAAYAAYAAAYDAAYVAAYAAAVAASDASDVAYVVAYAVAYVVDAHLTTLAQCADIVRRHYPETPRP